MKTLTLRLSRQEDHDTEGVFSVMKAEGSVVCVTLEPPMRGNQKSISCIPTGQYTCRRYSSKKYPDTWQVTNVPGRSKILFHAGNVVKHTKGCIIVAGEFGKLKGDRAVLNSGATFKNFMKATRHCDTLHLTITEDY